MCLLLTVEFSGLDLGYGIRMQEAVQTQLIPLPSNRPLMQSAHKNYSPFIKRVNTHMISDEKWI